MIQPLKLFASALLATVALPAVAAAQDARVTVDLNMRAGPATQFPVVTTIPEGYGVNIHGCVSDYDWCDVSWRGRRGWVFTDFLDYRYDGRYVPVHTYGPRIDLPIVSFSINSYWTDYYRDEPWFDNRSRWRFVWRGDDDDDRDRRRRRIDRDGRDYDDDDDVRIRSRVDRDDDDDEVRTRTTVRSGDDDDDDRDRTRVRRGDDDEVRTRTTVRSGDDDDDDRARTRVRRGDDDDDGRRRTTERPGDDDADAPAYGRMNPGDDDRIRGRMGRAGDDDQPRQRMGKGGGDRKGSPGRGEERRRYGDDEQPPGAGNQSWRRPEASGG